MRDRRSLQDVFSQFLSFVNDRDCRWVSDPHLRRSMQECLVQLGPQLAGRELRVLEREVALHWHRQWSAGAHPDAEQHLAAYLQPACYWAARQFVTGYFTGRFALSDCFQIASMQVGRVLRGFNASQGSDLPIYAARVFGSVIRETLRQQHEMRSCTDWALLREASKKRVEKALQRQGWNETLVAPAVVAWRCFLRVYAPTYAQGSRQLQRPSPEVWQAIFEEHNREAAGLGLPLAPNPEVIERQLLDLTRAIRSYLNPPETSYNRPVQGLEGDEQLNSLRSDGPESLLDALAEQEEEQQRLDERSELNRILKEALARLEPPLGEMVALYYSGAANQQEVARHFGLQQFQVSRQLQRARRELLEAAVRGISQAMHIPVDMALLKQTSDFIDEWLRLHFRR